MDILDTLRRKIDVIDDGDHTSGLMATLSHIEVAFRHLTRGQNGQDETAFTDAIYRTNQAFEGSIKEAYRVLTGNDPQRKTPYQIEIYLEKNTVFRERVLNQFKNYRMEWRNPSAHDYKLDFDESEAFLAIISVSAFACLLSDQIAGKIAFDVGKSTVQIPPMKDSQNQSTQTLYDKAAKTIQSFISSDALNKLSHTNIESILLGAIHGVFASTYPDIDVLVEARLSTNNSHRADLVLKHAQEEVIIELKRYSQRINVKAGCNQVDSYMEDSGIISSLLVYIPENSSETELTEFNAERSGGKIGVIAPKK